MTRMPACVCLLSRLLPMRLPSIWSHFHKESTLEIIQKLFLKPLRLSWTELKRFFLFYEVQKHSLVCTVAKVTRKIMLMVAVSYPYFWGIIHCYAILCGENRSQKFIAFAVNCRPFSIEWRKLGWGYFTHTCNFIHDNLHLWFSNFFSLLRPWALDFLDVPSWKISNIYFLLHISI